MRAKFSVTDGETGEGSRRWRAGPDRHIPDVRAQLVPDRLEEAVDLGGVSLGDQFDPPVREIAHVAGHVESSG